MEVECTVQLANGNRVHQTRISTKTDEDGFSPAVFRSRLERKTPIAECLFRCVHVLFSVAESILKIGGCFCFCYHNIFFLCAKCGKGSPRSAL